MRTLTLIGDQFVGVVYPEVVKQILGERVDLWDAAVGLVRKLSVEITLELTDGELQFLELCVRAARPRVTLGAAVEYEALLEKIRQAGETQVD